MAIYNLKAKGNYGNMPKGYEFQVVSTTTPTPDFKDIKKEIERFMKIGTFHPKIETQLSLF